MSSVALFNFREKEALKKENIEVLRSVRHTSQIQTYMHCIILALVSIVSLLLIVSTNSVILKHS